MLRLLLVLFIGRASDSGGKGVGIRVKNSNCALNLPSAHCVGRCLNGIADPRLFWLVKFTCGVCVVLLTLLLSVICYLTTALFNMRREILSKYFGVDAKLFSFILMEGIKCQCIFDHII
jgi:hypothetical protein